MSGLVIPADEPAEREVIGTAVGTPTGYRLAAAVVGPGDFRVARYGWSFAACADLDDVGPGWDSSERIRRVAEAAGVNPKELRQLVDGRTAYHDVNGHFARRVSDAARRRRAMKALADAFRALGEGATIDEAAALLSDAGGIARLAA